MAIVGNFLQHMSHTGLCPNQRVRGYAEFHRKGICRLTGM
jgi:hypothetical protein